MTLSELKEKVTDEELILWSCFYSLKNKKQQQEMEKIKRRR
jgi:hypothetical protein